MFTSTLYKEWIKTRWFMLIYTLLGVLALGLIFLKIQHDFKFVGGISIYHAILFKNYSFCSTLKYIPLIGGLLLGFSQFLPEITNKRIKLSFHLPINEDRLLLQMIEFGTLLLIIAYAIFFVVFLIMSNTFFPKEIIDRTISTITPWFLSGFAAYYLSALIILEPVWRKRFILSIIASLFISIFLLKEINGAYITINKLLTILTIFCSITLLYSGYRLKKGEQ